MYERGYFMNLSKFKKSLLVISNLALLLSCGEPSSSSEPTSSKDSSEEDSSLVEEDYKEELTKMLKELSKAVSYSSLVTVTSSTGTGENLQNYYGRYYLDVQTTKKEYAYQQYEGIESNTSLPKKEVVADSGYFYTDPFGNTYSNYLAINNVLIPYQISQDTIQGSKPVIWDESGLCDVFFDLKSDMFDKNKDGSFALNDKADASLRRNITANFFGSNTVPAAKDFILTIKDGHISEYYLSTETQKRYDPAYQASYTMQYEFEGNIVAYGEDNEEIKKNFIKQASGEKDEALEATLAKLRKNNYKETTSIYRVGEPDLSLKGTLAQKNETMYGNSTKVAKVYNATNKLLSSKYYYETEDNFIQEVIEIQGNYYNQGLKLSNSNLSTTFPQFAMSSLFFNKEEDGLYSYEMGNKNCQIFASNTFTEVTTSLLYSSTIDLRKENEVTISGIYAISSDSMTAYYKLVSTFADIGTTVTGIDPSKIKDGDSLTLEQLFAGDEYLSTAKKILGEDRFNSIATLGGYYNQATLFASEEDKQVQMQYYMGSLAIYDFDGDGSLSSYEQAALYSEVDRVLRAYSSKVDSTYWPELKAGLYPNTSLCIELTSTQVVSKGVELTLDVFFTYDQSSSSAYIVIEAKYNEKVSVTFDFNYEGAENVTKVINKGEKIDALAARRKGYMFLGWYKDKELTEIASFDSPITSDTTYYAKWEKIN